jgi:hypothetical protein
MIESIILANVAAHTHPPLAALTISSRDAY